MTEKRTTKKKTKRPERTEIDYANYKCGPTQCLFTPDAGKVPEGTVIKCGVCGTQMKEKRDCLGARSYAASLAGIKEKHDFFDCPHRGDDWHKQVVKLREGALYSFSAKLAAIYLEEAEEVLKARKVSKDDGYWMAF
jgi:hypothetical protein